jgi:hypothetical protein
MRPIEAVEMMRCGEVSHCEIRPAWDGSGSYVIAAYRPDAENTRWRILTHEDGAPLRYRDASRAYAHAVQSGLPADAVSVRWPPINPRRSGSGNTRKAEPHWSTGDVGHIAAITGRYSPMKIR